MLTRKIGKLIRGTTTPAQVLLAAIIGSVLGFMPGFTQSLGTIVLFGLALVILNANLFLATAVGVLSKAIALLLLPVSFQIGRLLLDGPTRPIFKAVINAPVGALLGLEYYATTGGIVLGVLVGSALGYATNRAIRAIRMKMAHVEEESERYRKYAQNPLLRFVLWVLVGPQKGSWADLAQQRGKVIRPIGVAAAVLFVVLGVLVTLLFRGPIVTAYLKIGLERANGATVDVESSETDLKEGRITINGLAMADPNALDTDLLRAEQLELDIRGVDLLRKRLSIDRLVVRDAQQGARRDVPGRIVYRQPRPSPQPGPDQKTIEDYLRTAKKWKERLAQVRRWIEKLTGPSETDPRTTKKSTKEWLEAQIRSHGYANVAAVHLIEGKPTLTILDVRAEKVRVAQLPGQTLDVHGEHLSTHPHLHEGTPKLVVTSSGQTLHLDLELGSIARTPGESKVQFAYRGLPVDSISDDLAFGGARPIAGGTLDVSLDGRFSPRPVPSLDLPLLVTLHETTVSIGTAGSRKIDQLKMPIGLSGPLDAPRVQFDTGAFARALAEAGAGELANELLGKAGRKLDDAVKEKLGDEVGENVTKDVGTAIKKGLGGLLGGKEDEQPSKEEPR